MAHDCQAEAIKDIEKRLRNVESLQLAYNEKFVILFQKLDDIHKSFKWFIGVLIVTLIGFFVWYIQSLGGI